MPALTPLVAKCYGTRPADVFFSDGLRGDQDDRLLQRCSAGGPHSPAMFFLALQPEPARFREEFDGQGAEAFSYMDDVSLGLMGVTASTVRAFAFLRRQLDDIGIVVNPAKTVAPPPKGHAPTAKEISILDSIDVRIADEGGAMVVRVPIGTDECVLERAMGVVKDRGADHLARCLADMPDKQAAALSKIESLGQRTSYLEKALDTGVSLEACRRADKGAQSAYEKILELSGAMEA